MSKVGTRYRATVLEPEGYIADPKGDYVLNEDRHIVPRKEEGLERIKHIQAAPAQNGGAGLHTT